MDKSKTEWLDKLLRAIYLFGIIQRVQIYINKALVRWGRKKYKMLSRYKTRASKFLEEMAKRSPQLFAHWRLKMRGGLV